MMSDVCLWDLMFEMFMGIPVGGGLCYFLLLRDSYFISCFYDLSGVNNRLSVFSKILNRIIIS